MPLNGINVIAGSVNELDGPVSLHLDWKWSEVIVSGATTTASMPTLPSSSGGAPAFLVQAGADGWISVGPTPNASSSPRRWVRAGEDVVIAANAGDRVSYVAG